MAKKKQAKRATVQQQKPPEPQPSGAIQDILLNWRFNLLVLGCMELLLILFFLPREIEHHRLAEGKKALLAGDYLRAYRYYFQLCEEDPDNPGYLKALGDAALGRGQYLRALGYYDQATRGRFNLPGMKIQVALAYHGLAQSERDPKRRAEYERRRDRFLQLARQEAPTDLKVNYWLGRFAELSGDLVEAAEFYSRVRADMIPRGRPPNEEQKRLIADARTRLKRIENAIFRGKDFSLKVSDLRVAPTPSPASPRSSKPTPSKKAPSKPASR